MLIAAGPHKGMDALLSAIRECRALLFALTDASVLAKMADRPADGALAFSVPLKNPTHDVVIEVHGDVVSISVAERPK